MNIDNGSLQCLGDLQCEHRHTFNADLTFSVDSEGHNHPHPWLEQFLADIRSLSVIEDFADYIPSILHMR